MRPFLLRLIKRQQITQLIQGWFRLLLCSLHGRLDWLLAEILINRLILGCVLSLEVKQIELLVLLSLLLLNLPSFRDLLIESEIIGELFLRLYWFLSDLIILYALPAGFINNAVRVLFISGIEAGKLLSVYF